MSIIVFLIILTLLVLVHELGHFIAARKNGVRVDEFGIGFPPRLFSIKKGETTYSINAIPIGGFVKLYGEEYHENTKKELRQKAFVYKKPWQKATIIIGGVVGNFLLAWVLISYLFTQGVPAPINKVLVENVISNTPAAKAGIKKNDIIFAIKETNKKSPITSSNDLIDISKKYGDRQIILLIERDGQTLETTITPRKNPPSGQGPLGVVITSFMEKKYSWYQAPFFGLIESFKISQKIAVEVVNTLVKLVTFQKPQVDVAGPIGIAQYTDQAIKFGKNAILELLALLSLNLAIVNILPFPALDGGRLIFVIYEWVSKKRVNQTIERYLNLAGIIILLSLALLISYRDIVRLIR